MLLAVVDAAQKRFYRAALIALRLVVGNEFEVHGRSSQPLATPCVKWQVQCGNSPLGCPWRAELGSLLANGTLPTQKAISRGENLSIITLSMSTPSASPVPTTPPAPGAPERWKSIFRRRRRRRVSHFRREHRRQQRRRAGWPPTFAGRGEAAS